MSKPTVSANRVALLDADGVLWAAAMAGETLMDGEQVQLLDFSAVFKDACRRLERQIRWTGADQAFVCLSDRRNFRQEIMPPGHPFSIKGLGYKGQRGSYPRPLLLDSLRQRFREDSPYRVLLVEGLEADDVCGISSGQLRQAGKDPVIVSPDKDLLQVPGTLCTIVLGKPVFTKVTEEAADHFHVYQTLAGDTVDNYTGLPGWGARKAGDFLDTCRAGGLGLKDIWEQVRDVFSEVCEVAASDMEDELLALARVSRILRSDDWNADTHEPVLWEFPTY